MRLYDPKNPMQINALKDILDPGKGKKESGEKNVSLIEEVAKYVNPEESISESDDEQIDMANFLDEKPESVHKSKVAVEAKEI